MTRLLALTLTLSLLPGCSGCDRRIDVPPMRRYAQTLVDTSQAKLTVDSCAMFDDSRKGYCLLAGPAPEVAAFAKGLGLSPKSTGPAFGNFTCLALSGFGRRQGDGRITQPSVQQFLARGKLPKNTDNVRFVAAYVGRTSICVEMQYPYG